MATQFFPDLSGTFWIIAPHLISGVGHWFPSRIRALLWCNELFSFSRVIFLVSEAQTSKTLQDLPPSK